MTGLELKAIRDARAWSQEDLAAELGVTQAAVSLYESGKRPIPGPVERLARRIAEEDGGRT